MKVQKLKLLNQKVLAGIIASFALFFSIIGANSCCCCIFHQPDKPELGKLRKY